LNPPAKQLQTRLREVLESLYFVRLLEEERRKRELPQDGE
jgi:hypothetical protein